MLPIVNRQVRYSQTATLCLFSLWVILLFPHLTLAQESQVPSKKNTSNPAYSSVSIDKQKEQEKIEKLIKEKKYPKSYKLARQFHQSYPKDLNAIYLLAFIEKEVHFFKKGLLTLQEGLKIDPENVDLSILKAEILIKQGHLKRARNILMTFKKSHPQNKTLQEDLIKTYFPNGYENNFPAMDQHLFSLGQIQSPFGMDTFLISTSPSWAINITGLGINYSGGSVYIADAQLESPMPSGIRFIAGRTEYMGFSPGKNNGTNSWTYAGLDTRISDHLDLLVNAGDTSLGRAGIYGHFIYNPGVFSLDIQGINNMVWGDFGQAVQLNGSESGVSVSASLQLSSRFSVGGSYWYYDYMLNNGSLPYGNLHNTFGYIDYQITQDPSLDLLVGYDDWSILGSTPSIVALVPEIVRQQYILVAINGLKQYENGIGINGQIGGYNDFYNHLASFEAAAGIRYPVSMHWSFYGNAVYFEESTLYSGPSEELMLGINFLF
ncbi:MAG: tetratricopeptide repeat protein [Leptospirales bacterium]